MLKHRCHGLNLLIIVLLLGNAMLAASQDRGESEPQQGNQTQGYGRGYERAPAPNLSQPSGYSTRPNMADRQQQMRERAYSRDARNGEQQNYTRVPLQRLPDNSRREQDSIYSRASDVSLREAMDSVQRNTEGKILGAETMRVRGQEVHRIKVYTRDGRVRTLQVPANQIPMNQPLLNQPGLNIAPLNRTPSDQAQTHSPPQTE